jgi:predicted RNA methylase
MATEDPLPVGARGLSDPSHWFRWHAPYDDPASNLSLRLRTVQEMVRAVLDTFPSERDDPIRIVSLCAGQGRDVIDVVATHPRRPLVSALLVELDPALVAFARTRADAAGVGGQVQVVEGDASLTHWYEHQVPADLVLACGVFGNISAADITATVRALAGFLQAGGDVIWTRHRRPPDATPAIRADFAAAGFDEVAFVAPEGTVMTVGHHRLTGMLTPFDPGRKLFDFVGDGFMPA